MKLGFLSTALAAAFLSQFASAAVIGQIDTFQDGTTDNWFAGGLGMGQIPPVPPQVVAAGGPAGAGDQFLQITALGGNGPGSRIAAINLNQWTGDYLHSPVTGIAMDLKNLGATDLTVRLLFEDPMMAPPADQAVTTFGQTLKVGSGWTHTFFAIAPSAFTVLSGDINTLLANTTLIRIIENPIPADAEPIVGVLGVDNIAAAVPEPTTLLPVCGLLLGFVFTARRNQRVSS
jgi:hypothetical protein